jgi:hypothetical protein
MVFENLNKHTKTTALGLAPSSSYILRVWTIFEKNNIRSPLIGARWKLAKTVFENLNKPAYITALGLAPSSSYILRVWTIFEEKNIHSPLVGAR